MVSVLHCHYVKKMTKYVCPYLLIISTIINNKPCLSIPVSLTFVHVRKKGSRQRQVGQLGFSVVKDLESILQGALVGSAGACRVRHRGLAGGEIS